MFLEFLEAIVHFSLEWYSEKERKIKEKSVKNDPTAMVSGEAEVSTEDKNEMEVEGKGEEKEEGAKGKVEKSTSSFHSPPLRDEIPVHVVQEELGSCS